MKTHRHRIQTALGKSPAFLGLLLCALVRCLPESAAAGGEPPAATPAAADISFCSEVLILHHSHVDAGYTHVQSMYWELQRGSVEPWRKIGPDWNFPVAPPSATSIPARSRAFDW